MKSSLNIVFAGTPAFGLPCLEAIAHSEHHLKAIYTQPDRPAGRGRKLQPSPVKQWALARDVPVFQPLNFKTQDARDALAALNPDVLVVIAYGLILPRSVLDIPRLGCMNVHASLLPRWRGASPIQQAVLHGDARSGITIMQMDVGLDTGAMLAKAECTLNTHETAGTLHDTLAHLAPDALMGVLNALGSDALQPEIQDEAYACYAPKIEKQDAHIHWALPVADIDRRIRAFYPWPIAFTEYEGERIRIHQAKPLLLPADAPPGTIVSIDRDGMRVAAKEGLLNIEQLQFAGGKVLSIAQWMNSGRFESWIGRQLT